VSGLARPDRNKKFTATHKKETTISPKLTMEVFLGEYFTAVGNEAWRFQLYPKHFKKCLQ
jgi:hypothetical protein